MEQIWGRNCNQIFSGAPYLVQKDQGHLVTSVFLPQGHRTRYKIIRGILDPDHPPKFRQWPWDTGHWVHVKHKLALMNPTPQCVYCAQHEVILTFFSQIMSPIYFNNFAVLVNFPRHTFGAPIWNYFCCRGSPFHSKVGPHCVPILKEIGPPCMWEQWG